MALADIIAAATNCALELTRLRDMQDRKRALQQDLQTLNSDIDAQQLVVDAAKASLKALL